MTLTVVPATGSRLEVWRSVHNLVIPATPLTADDVATRAGRNQVTLGFEGSTLVGNATVRAPVDGVVVVIVRVLPEHRRRGLGREYLDRLLADVAPAVEADLTIGTCVLAANGDGLQAARRWGFVETDRYEVDGAQFVDLELPTDRRP